MLGEEPKAPRLTVIDGWHRFKGTMAPRWNDASVVDAVPPCGRTAASYAPAMALPVVPLLAVGLLGYAGYRMAKTAVTTAGRDRRRRDWFAVQDPEAVAAGKEDVVHGGGAGLLDRRAWLKANALSTSYEFEDGAVRFEH